MSAMIVPVWVSSKNRPRDEHLVYALLDTQSDTTFVLESTADMLDNHPEIAKLRLSTMSTRDSTIECKKLNDLQIRGYNQNVYIDLPTTYSRDFIPINRSHIPTKATAEKCMATLTRDRPPNDTYAGLRRRPINRL